MVDDFMVCVDQIITSACFESVNGREKLLRNVADEVGIGENSKNVSFLKRSEVGFLKISEKNGDEGCFSKMVRECRICQEDDEEHDMEAPCACNGTLKFAHRKCIQRWCNKKGDITCEICNQVFSPNYALPPAKSNPDVMAIDIRQVWGPHIDLQDPRFLAFTAADRQFLQSEYEDYAVVSSGSITCFRSVAIILMLVLLIHQALMVTRDFEMVQDSSTFFNFQVSLLQLAGFLLPCYVIARSWYIVQSRRRRQG